MLYIRIYGALGINNERFKCTPSVSLSRTEHFSGGDEGHRSDKVSGCDHQLTCDIF